MRFPLALALGAALCLASPTVAAQTTPLGTAESIRTPAPSPMPTSPSATAGNDTEGSGATHLAPAEGAEAEPTPKELINDIGRVINDWSKLGYLAGLIALLQLLMKLLKFGPINNWFQNKRRKWIKPYIAAGLGAAAMVAVSYQTSGHLLNSLVAGALAGMGAVGWNELLNKWKAEKRLG